MQTIITPTDFSDISLNAVNYAADMAMNLKANLLVVHASEFVYTPGEKNFEPEKEELVIEEKLEDVKNSLLKRTNGEIKIYTKQVTGIIENEIIKLSGYQNPVAVVMATRGANMKEHIFLESITVHLSKNLKFPLIVVPKNESYKPVRRILLATDLEHLYNLPVETITNMVTVFNARLDVVHVYDNENKFDVMCSRMNELIGYFKNTDAHFRFIKSNNVQTAILDFAQRNKTDVIIIIPKKHAFFYKSKSKQLIFNSPVTVMSIQ